jgi:signal transduction histidine kinase
MRIWIAAFFIFLCVNGSAQLPDYVRFTNITAADGLPEETITSITQDHRGFLWLGSPEGLIRFDGMHFKTWHPNPADSTRFSSSQVLVIGEYTPGKILFMSGQTLWEINIRNLQLSQVPYFRSKNITTRPQRLGKNNWFVAGTDSLYITDEQLKPLYTLAIHPYFTFPAAISCFPLHDPYALVYEGVENKIYLLNYRSRELIPFTFDNSRLDNRSKFFIPRAYDSSRQRLYLTAYFNGSFYCDLNLPLITAYQAMAIPALPDGSVTKSMLLPNGILLQGGHNGLYLTDFVSTLHFTMQTAMDNPLHNNNLLDIYLGKDSIIWLATMKGISSFRLPKPEINYLFRNLNFKDNDELISIVKGADAHMYFLNRNLGLFRFNRVSQIVKHIDSFLVYSWAAVRHDKYILASGGGKQLLRYNTRTGKTDFPQYLKPFFTPTTDLITLVYKSSNGDMWFSCNGGAGIIRNPAGTQQFIQYSRNNSPPSFSLGYVHSVAEDRRGNIWWGNNKNSILLMWDAVQEKFFEYPLQHLIPGLPYYSGIQYLYADVSDQLWIALDMAALVKYDIRKKTALYIDINRGLPSNSVSAITADKKNRIWMKTKKGLCCYLPDDGRIIVFSTHDGFPETQFDSRGIFYDEEEDLLYIAARKSLSWFHPDTLLNKILSLKPAIYIDEIQVNGKPFYFSEDVPVHFKAHETNFTFGISAPDFSRNDQLIFQYRLNGKPDEWADLGSNRIITFHHLPHGKHQLYVRSGYRGADMWSEAATPFIFTIQTPWQKTWWFRTAAIIILIFVSGWIIRLYYVRQLEKKQTLMEKEIAIEQERTKLARELHDGLGSMLSGIKHSFAAMLRQFHLTPEEENLFQSNLEKLNQSIVELRHISHNMASDALLKYGLEYSLRDYCNNLAASSGIPIRFHAVNTEHLKLKEEISFHIFRAVQELLQNIIKHAGATEVLVQLSSYSNRLDITVEDNGAGFNLPVARKQKSMGLKNLESRIDLLKGDMDYRTAPGQGTSVMITVPLN